MKYKHILFVEDEEEQRDSFETAVKDWNGRNEAAGRSFTYDISPDVQNAKMSLERIRFDGALFDLRVKNTVKSAGRADAAGNGLALSALRQHGIPVAIITADATVLDDEVRTAGKVEIFDKNSELNELGNAYDNAVEWFSSLWSMMEILNASRRRIDSSAADIFLHRLWPRWEIFANLEAGGDDGLTGIVTRQYVSHIADLLGLDGPDNVSWHPFENYIHPALLTDRAHTGDIFEFGEELWVVLTPQCDMATRKVPNVILAKCVPGVKDWTNNLAALRAADSNNKRKGPLEFLRGHVNQDVGSAKHFLPPLPGRNEPLLVHFNSIMSLPMPHVNGRLGERVASISTPFLSNIVQRFGAYISRMGQPNIDVDRFL